MNDGLADAFRHNGWATGELIAACASLTDAQLEAPVAGTYGSVIATLRHIMFSEANYAMRLSGDEPPWRSIEEPAGIDELSARARDLGERWQRFLARPFDGERTIVVAWPDGVDHEVPAAIYVAQALQHGNEHRAQVCVALSQSGITPPSLGVWDYAEAANRTKALRR